MMLYKNLLLKIFKNLDIEDKLEFIYIIGDEEIIKEYKNKCWKCTGVILYNFEEILCIEYIRTGYIHKGNFIKRDDYQKIVAENVYDALWKLFCNDNNFFMTFLLVHLNDTGYYNGEKIIPLNIYLDEILHIGRDVLVPEFLLKHRVKKIEEFRKHIIEINKKENIIKSLDFYFEVEKIYK